MQAECVRLAGESHARSEGRRERRRLMRVTRKMLWFAGAVLLGVAPMVAQRPGGGNPWSYGNGGPGNWDSSWNSRPNPRAGACFYTNQNFGGNHFCVRAGDRLNKLPGNFGDNISSIQVFGRARVQVFDDRDYRGPNYVFRDSVADLRQVPSRPGHTWNNRISSVAMR